MAFGSRGRGSGIGTRGTGVTSYVFTEAELRRAVGLEPASVDAIADGFRLLAEGRVRQPPILRVDVPDHDGEVDVKAAYVPGWDSFAIKVSTGFFGNPGRGLPTGLGLMVLLSSETGETRAMLLDNGYLTRVRTALAGAVAARALAREDVRVVGMIGAGDQARWQLRALRLVRPIERAVVWARRSEAAEAYAREMSRELGIAVRRVARPADVFAHADVVVTTTPATTPLVEADWLRPGMHVTAMGSDAESKQELTAAAVLAADLVVCDHVGQSRRLGELRTLGDDHAQDVAELGAVVAGTHAGRATADQITVCDLTGTGVQDTVIARLAVHRCLEAGAGHGIEQQQEGEA